MNQKTHIYEYICVMISISRKTPAMEFFLALQRVSELNDRASFLPAEGSKFQVVPGVTLACGIGEPLPFGVDSTELDE